MAEMIRRRRRRVAMLVWGGMTGSWSGVFGEERGRWGKLNPGTLRWAEGYHRIAKLLAEDSKVSLWKSPSCCVCRYACGMFDVGIITKLYAVVKHYAFIARDDR